MAPFWHPWATLKSHIFFLISFVAALAPSWRQEGPQSAPRQPQGQIFYDFLLFFERFWTAFSLIFHLHLNRISRSSLLSIFMFSYRISSFNLKLQLQLHVFSLKFWHGGGLSRACALDIYICMYIQIYIYIYIHTYIYTFI